MSWILDLLVLLIAGLSIFLAYKKGLFRSLFSLVGFVVTIILAVSLCNPVAQWIDDEFVNPAVKEMVLNTVNGEDYNGDYDEALNSIEVVDIFEQMPDGLRSFLEGFNIDVDEIISSAQESDDTADAKNSLIDRVASPISGSISRVIAMIILLVVLFIVLFILTRLLDKIFHVLPLVKNVNAIGGIVFGVLRGALLVLIFCSIVYGLSGANWLITADQVEDTYLVKEINEINPILNALK